MMPASARQYLRSGLTQAASLADGVRRRLYGPVTNVRTADKVAALTFDDGPNPVYTPRLLEVLRRHGAKATFFMLGSAAQAHPDLVEAVAEAGHAIGNHSYSHRDFRAMSRHQRKQEILDCAQSLKGHESRIFRPPHGWENLACHFDARSLGYTVVKWTISTGDWNEISGSEISQWVSRRLRPGAIILLHDSIAKNPQADRSHMIDAVERLLEATAGAYDYLTLPEMFKRGRPSTGRYAAG
jgi:peptidoglycan/xylan/chitin deacetylase (PgdA/CDA1 family)